MDRVHLIGADDIDRAGRNIASAADQMDRAAGNLEHSLDRHASRTEEAFRIGLPADQLELMGLVALLNYETALINAEVAATGKLGHNPTASETPRRLHALLEKVRGA